MITDYYKLLSFYLHSIENLLETDIYVKYLRFNNIIVDLATDEYWSTMFVVAGNPVTSAVKKKRLIKLP